MSLDSTSSVIVLPVRVLTKLLGFIRRGAGAELTVVIWVTYICTAVNNKYKHMYV